MGVGGLGGVSTPSSGTKKVEGVGKVVEFPGKWGFFGIFRIK